MKKITRFIKNQIIKDLPKGKVIVIYGARRVGKTTLVQDIAKVLPIKSLYLNCDEPDLQRKFFHKNSTELKQTIGEAKLVILDEAQRIKDIGFTLKLLIDTFPGLQVIATGSSSFELAQKVAEPLTGRSYLYQLFPFSEGELRASFGDLEVDRGLAERLTYGMYPEIMFAPDQQEKERLLKQMSSDYLFKDLLHFGRLKRSDVLYPLLQTLALQIGNEVSLNELAQLCGIDKTTVQDYLYLLEQAFIVFTLRPFSRNLRKELGKKRKVYFYDVGLRNAIIRNFNQPDLRSDLGFLWENYCIAERFKRNHYKRQYANAYFWRTYDRQKIDLVEDYEGKLTGFEIKWGDKKGRLPKIFLETYPNSSLKFITQKNYQEFLAL